MILTVHVITTMIREENYCSFEISRELQDIGYPGEYSEVVWYRHVWMDSPRLEYRIFAESEAETINGVDIYPAPSLSDAQKWYREKGIHIKIFYELDRKWGCIAELYKQTPILESKPTSDFNTYEEALEDIIQQLIKGDKKYSGL